MLNPWLDAGLAIALVSGVSWALRVLAKRSEDYYERDDQPPTILQSWNE